ncbi:AbrB/MazE/SpoVT family DNA-binding domain-containing protein [Bacillus sp. FSL K6-3431]|uniref:AbrB/MazE/SpoVT family DNA-binding domain-containing protein n=1 Tax=Bacillus sp. FSL K6-3431 TaxID=2921500 RepID=UPI0030FCEDB9
MSVNDMPKEKLFVRKIHQQGNSLSVGIPAEIVEDLKIKKGQEFEAVYVEGSDEIIFRKKKEKRLPDGIDLEFLDILGGVLDDYDEAIKNLKDR